MCHLCRKAVALQDVDNRITKPIYALLLKIHKHTKDSLGEFWLVRHQHMMALQRLIEGLPQVAPVKAFLKSVHHELQHVESSMVDHHFSQETGKGCSLDPDLAPNDSVSVKIRERKLNKQETNSERQKLKRKEEFPQSFDEEGSDLEPATAVVLHSKQKVSAWLSNCDLAMLKSQRQDGHNITLVSVLNGKKMRRSTVDGGAVWRRAMGCIPTGFKTSIKNSHRAMSSSKNATESQTLRTCLKPKWVAEKKEKLPSILKKRKCSQGITGASFDKFQKPPRGQILVKKDVYVRRDKLPSVEPKSGPRSRSPAESTRRIVSVAQAIPDNGHFKVVISSRRPQDSSLGISATDKSSTQDSANGHNSIARKGTLTDTEIDSSCASPISSSQSLLTNSGEIFEQSQSSLGRDLKSSETSHTMTPQDFPKSPTELPSMAHLVCPNTSESRVPQETLHLISELQEQPCVQDEARCLVDHPPILILNRTAGSELPPRTPPKIEENSLSHINSKLKKVREESRVSAAVKESRKRRAKRAECGIPFTDRYQREERYKFWNIRGEGLSAVIEKVSGQ